MSIQPSVDLIENRKKMASGELYYAFTDDLVAIRKVSTKSCYDYNLNGKKLSRRKQIELMKLMIPNLPDLPKKVEDMTEEKDEVLFNSYPFIEPPFRCDYGQQVCVSKFSYTYKNANLLLLIDSSRNEYFYQHELRHDRCWSKTLLRPTSLSNSRFCEQTCKITIGTRTLFGPDVSLYSGSHPTNPDIRQGLAGPEMGGEIEIGDDCWLGGKVIVLAGVKIGRGSVVGAGSVVTKNVEPFSIVVGNPARFLRRVEGVTADKYFSKTKGKENFPSNIR